MRRRVYGILFNEHHRVFTQVILLVSDAFTSFFQGRQEEELVMAKAKVSEIAKKLAAVKPDSIVLKNKEPRSVMIILGTCTSRCQCVCFRKRRCLARDLRQLQLCWISWLEFALIWKLVFKRNGKGKS